MFHCVVAVILIFFLWINRDKPVEFNINIYVDRPLLNNPIPSAPELTPSKCSPY